MIKKKVKKPATAAVPKSPRIGVIVVVHNMRREAARTLHSLSPSYQRGIQPSEYEVIVVENGSSEPLDRSFIRGLPGNFRYFSIKKPGPSPVPAINFGLSKAVAPVLGVMIDGARLVTPGLLARALEASATHPSAVVGTMGWYLGCDMQGEALQSHYSQQVEDRLLETISWPSNGYRLFEISVPDQSSWDGWFSPMFESNALFMSTQLWKKLGGYNPRFDSPGGGFANLDVLTRAAKLVGSRMILLTEEATFHQAHGGIATNAASEVLNERVAQWQAQYEQICGERFTAPKFRTFLYGGINPHMARTFARALMHPLKAHRDSAEGRKSVLGIPFDTALWDSPLALKERLEKDQSAPHVKAAIALAHSSLGKLACPEVGYICRRILGEIESHEEACRLLRLTALARLDDSAPPARRASYLATLAKTESLFGSHAKAAELYGAALQTDELCDIARSALAAINLPGDDYFTMLSKLHEYLKPATYLEVGIFTGNSMALARPPTRAVGVDPVPRINGQCSVEFTVVPTTSDSFFDKGRAAQLLPNGASMTFIDGLHEYMQVVRDFWNVERHSAPGAVVLIHDTIPFDEISAGKVRKTGWWTGDTWKIVPFLKACRPDLEIFTIKTPPSGLTVVSRLKPDSEMSLQRFQDMALEFEEAKVASVKSGEIDLNLVANRWEDVEARLGNVVNDYQVGTTINFSLGGNSALYTREGWSFPERLGTWTVGKEAHLMFKPVCNDQTPSAINGVMEVIPFAVPQRHECTLELIVNNKPVLIETLTAPRRHNLQFSLSPDQFYLDRCEVLLCFSIVQSPKGLGISGDARELGVCTCTLTFQRA